MSPDGIDDEILQNIMERHLPKPAGVLKQIGKPTWRIVMEQAGESPATHGARFREYGEGNNMTYNHWKTTESEQTCDCSRQAPPDCPCWCEHDCSQIDICVMLYEQKYGRLVSLRLAETASD
jgi:hypothetical protein